MHFMAHPVDDEDLGHVDHEDYDSGMYVVPRNCMPSLAKITYNKN